MAIKWSEDYATGFADIDNQHKELIVKFDNFLEACKSAKGKEEGLKVLQFLEEYVIYHFGCEEKLMKQYNYPDILKHVKDHQDFIGEMMSFKKKVQDHGMDLSLVISLSQKILDWLIKHIGNMDTLLGSYLKEQQKSRV